MLAKTLDGAQRQLHRTIERCAKEQDRRGYFATMLWQATQVIEQDLAQGRFAHPERVQQLQTHSVNRYLAAVHAWDQRRAMSPAWQAVFRCDAVGGLLVLQHLQLAYQVHLRLDVGVALATAVPREELNGFLQNFQQQAQVLEALIDRQHGELTASWPSYRRLLQAFNRTDRGLIGYRPTPLAPQAWEYARRLSVKDEDEREELIEARDRQCAQPGQALASPAFTDKVLLALLRKTERGSVGATIGTLRKAPTEAPQLPLSGAA